MFLKTVCAFKEIDGLKNIAIPISSKHFLSSGKNKLLLVTFLGVAVVCSFWGEEGEDWGDSELKLNQVGCM